MKKFFTPGPSELYPTVRDHLRNALEEQVMSISHRSAAFMEIYRDTEENLRELLGVPEGYYLFFLSSANECWERICQNCIEKTSYHLVNGSFSKRFYEFVNEYGKEALKHEVPFGDGFGEIPEIPENVELIAAIANETSSGVRTDPEFIYQLRAKYPEKLLVVDVVSAVPAYQIDISKTDAVYFSVQKGFGMPAGLGVLILSERMIKRSEELGKKGIVTGSYHRFDSLLEKANKYQNPETPNVLGIYLLGKIAADMNRRKNEILAESNEKATLLYDFFSSNENFEVFVKNPAFRSETVVVIATKTDSSNVINALKEKGFVIGSGYGNHKNEQIRIANFPSSTLEEMQELLNHFP